MQDLIIAILVAFVIALASGHVMIPLLRRLKAGQQIRDDGPQSHLTKAGTPTMGGVFIAIGVIVTLLLFTQESFSYLLFAVIGSLAFGIIGLIDDLIIVLKKRSKGLKVYQKLILQFIFAVLISMYAYNDPAIGSSIYIPIAEINWDMGLWIIPFNVFFIMALTNSVNLTDGLDGLAGGVTLVDLSAYAIIFLSMTSSFVWKHDMIIFAAAGVGAVLAFLRFNTYPAKVFMGDTGAFFLGGMLTMLTVISRLQIAMVVMGFMFVLSSLSCILQVLSYKIRKKRIFKMAPLHHHFELKGVHETKIVSSYMLVTVVLCLLVLWAMV